MGPFCFAGVRGVGLAPKYIMELGPKRRITAWIKMVAILSLAIAFYPFGPTLVRLFWHATHSRTIDYASGCISVPNGWFAYQGRNGPVLVKIEAVFARRMWDLGFVTFETPGLPVPYERYRDSLKVRQSTEIVSEGGLEAVCTDWDEDGRAFTNSCNVRNKFAVSFTGPLRFRDDYRNLVRGIIACSAVPRKQ